jgi:hypothetical protein
MSRLNTNPNTNPNWRVQEQEEWRNPKWNITQPTKTVTRNSFKKSLKSRKSSKGTQKQNATNKSGKRNNLNTVLERHAKSPEFELFWKRYLGSLKYDSGFKDSQTTAYIYLTNILESLNTFISNPKTSNEGAPEISDIFSLIDYNIGKAKEGMKLLEGFSREMSKLSYLTYHGKPTFILKKVPDNCILVIKTPINRIGIYNPEIDAKMRNFLKNYDDVNNFLFNPVGYDKDIINGNFTFSNVYFPGQYYFDIMISAVYPDKEDYNGFYKNSGLTQYEIVKRQIELQGEENKKILEITDYEDGKHKAPIMALSHIIKEQNITGVLIVECCRSYENDFALLSKLNIPNSLLLYRYEHFIKILNASYAYGNDEEKYKNHDIFKSYPDLTEMSILFTKYRNSNNRNSRYLEFQKFLSTTDRSLSITIDYLRRANFSDEIINCFLDINLRNDNHIEVFEILYGLIQGKLSNFFQIVNYAAYFGFNMDPFYSAIIYWYLEYNPIELQNITFANFRILFLNGLNTELLNIELGSNFGKFERILQDQKLLQIFSQIIVISLRNKEERKLLLTKKILDVKIFPKLKHIILDKETTELCSGAECQNYITLELLKDMPEINKSQINRDQNRGREINKKVAKELLNHFTKEKLKQTLRKYSFSNQRLTKTNMKISLGHPTPERNLQQAISTYQTVLENQDLVESPPSKNNITYSNNANNHNYGYDDYDCGDCNHPNCGICQGWRWIS